MAFPLFEGFINSHTIKDLIEERSECTLIDTEVWKTNRNI